MKILLLGARGAVGTVIRRELEQAGHEVDAASRQATGALGVDLRGDLEPLARIAARYDAVVNASGVERADIAQTTTSTPLIDISASGAYLEELHARATGPIVLGAGLVPGLSTVLAAGLESLPGDELDVCVMLGSGEQHGPAAVEWTAGLVGAELYRPPEGRSVMNLRGGVRSAGPDGRVRRYLRADFPDHVLLNAVPGRSHGEGGGLRVRSYLTLSSSALTWALAVVGRLPALRGLLKIAPHAGNSNWHVVVHNRRTGERLQAEGVGQSEATGRLAALATIRAVDTALQLPATMADIVSLDDVRSVLA